jgi:hypothetical protein
MDTIFTFQPNASLANRSLAANNNNKNFARTRTTPQHILTPGPYDIVCGRTSSAYNNVGNRRFRVTISLNLQRYLQAKSRSDKSDAILSVVRLLRDDVGARFLKRGRGNVWIELDENKAREKVGHALRDMAVLPQQQQQEEEEKKQQPGIEDEEQPKTIFETTAKSTDLDTMDMTTKSSIPSRNCEDTISLPPLNFSWDTLDSLIQLCNDNDNDSMDPLPVFQNVAEKA